jgi:C-terminal processing protease CtpA/Prc
VANYESQGGQQLEGHGVVPDVEVPLSRESLLAEGDPVLKAAIAWIDSH